MPAVVECGGIEGGAGGGWRSFAVLRSDEAGRHARSHARQGTGAGDREVSRAGEGAMGALDSIQREKKECRGGQRPRRERTGARGGEALPARGSGLVVALVGWTRDPEEALVGWRGN